MGRITASRKQLKPDPVHESMLASKFINCLMCDGKKSTAQRVFYDALDVIKERYRTEPIEVFTQAVENVKPPIEVRTKRVGGAAYQVPIQVNRARQQSLAIRWLCWPSATRRDGRRTRSWPTNWWPLQPRRRCHDPPRKRPPHGRRQQGVRPFRLVAIKGSTGLGAGDQGSW